jgi:hypothetical protein
MKLSSFELKTRIYAVVVILLFVLVEWVSDITTGVSAITSFLKGVF